MVKKLFILIFVLLSLKINSDNSPFELKHYNNNYYYFCKSVRDYFIGDKPKELYNSLCPEILFKTPSKEEPMKLTITQFFDIFNIIKAKYPVCFDFKVMYFEEIENVYMATWVTFIESKIEAKAILIIGFSPDEKMRIVSFEVETN